MKNEIVNFKLYSFVCLILVQLTSCKLGNDKSNSGDTITTEFIKGEDLNADEWNCTQHDNNLICIPHSWKIINQETVFYFTTLDHTNDYRYNYFTITKFNVDSNNLTSEQYLKEGYRQLLNDSTETFTGYTLKRMKFKDKQSYYAEYFSKSGEKEYFGYSMVFEQKGFLYDIALRVDKDISEKYRDTFRDILFNFKIDDENVFSKTDEFESIDDIKFTDL